MTTSRKRTTKTKQDEWKFKLGKKDATYDSRDLRLSDVSHTVRTQALPQAPDPNLDWSTSFDDWLMLGNGPDDTVSEGFEGCGDCAWAGPAHEIMLLTYNAQRPVPTFSGKTIVDQYSEYSGYDPSTGENDTGSNVREVLKWRQSKGILDDSETAYKIGPYVSLEPRNLGQLWEALWLFESVGIGVKFPDSAMDQFNAGQPWSVVPGANIEGGHYVPLVGHPTGESWTCITWGRRQSITSEFLATYCDEAWAYVSPERYNSVTGETPESFKDVDLEKFITLVGQH